MSERELPARPHLEQYKKQAKDLAGDCSLGIAEALARVQRHHPRYYKLPDAELRSVHVSLTDAQLVLAREHGFETWPKFAAHIETLRLIRSVATISDPVAAFIEVACVPRHSDHVSGTLEHAEMILARYPQVATSNIYTAAILGDEPTARGFLSRDVGSATAKGGPHDWDALTYLCFSRYLKLDLARSEAFVGTARALLDAGASANSGWYEMIDHPNPRPLFESAIYGAATVARHAEVTRLLLERGADPNDEETPYHLPEGYDNTVMKIVLDSGTLNSKSLAVMLLRKTDWHDEEGLRLVLGYGADPNIQLAFGTNAIQHAVRRDNALKMIELLLDHGADPAVKSIRDGRSATATATHKGRGDVLTLLEQRGMPLGLVGVDVLIAACAKGDREAIQLLVSREPRLAQELIAEGGTLLADFAGNGNVDGLRCLLEIGVSPSAVHSQGDPYFDIARDSTALHVAAWRARPSAVKELIARGTPVNALDAKGRTALALAVKACVDSYWKGRRTPESVDALLRAGASVSGIDIPTGYEDADELIGRYGGLPKVKSD